MKKDLKNKTNKTYKYEGVWNVLIADFLEISMVIFKPNLKVTDTILQNSVSEIMYSAHHRGQNETQGQFFSENNCFGFRVFLHLSRLPY